MALPKNLKVLKMKMKLNKKMNWRRFKVNTKKALNTV